MSPAPSQIRALAADLGSILARTRRSEGGSLDAVAARLGETFDAACVVFFFADDGETVDPAAYWHRDPDVHALLGEYVQAVTRVADSRLMPRVRRGDTVLLDDPAAVAVSIASTARPFAQRAGTSSLMLIPVPGVDRVVGGVHFSRFGGEPAFTDEDVRTADALVHRIAAALDTARLLRALSDSPGDAADQVRARPAGHRAAFEAAPLAMAIVRHDGHGREIVAANAALARLLARSTDELVGSDLDAVVHRDDQGAGEPLPPPDADADHAPRRRRYVRPDGSTVVVDQWTAVAPGATPDLSVVYLRKARGSLEAERRLSTLEGLFEHHSDAMLAVGPDGEITDWNRAAELLYGYSADEIIGRSFELLVPEDRLAEAHVLLARVLEGEPVRVETTRRARGGAPVDVELSLSPVRDAAERVTGAVGISRDISTERQMRAELASTDERYRRIVEAAGEGVWVVGREGRSTFANSALGEMLGCAPEAIVGRPFEDFLAADRVESGRTAFRDQHVEGRFETRLARADGRQIHVLLNVRPLHGEGGAFDGVLALVTDIDSRVRAESALRESEGLTRSILDAARDGIVTVESDGRIVELNRASERLFGRSREELLGACAIGTLVTPSHRDALAAALARSAGEDRPPDPWQTRLELLCADGAVVPAEVTFACVPGHGDRYTAYIRDITEQLRVEEERGRRIEEHARVAQLSRHAIGGSIDDLADEAVNMVRDVLGVEHAEMWELDAKGAGGMQRAVAGWSWVPGRDEGDLRGLATRATGATVVVVPDAANADAVPSAWRTNAARVAAIVPIHTRSERSRWVLCAIAEQDREFCGDARDFLETAANVIAAALDKASAEAEVARNALHDPLTGLPNRTLFADRIREGLRAPAPGAVAPVAVLVLGLDRFDEIKEAFGYSARDRLLRAVTDRLIARLDPSETLARLGGDGFGLLSPRAGERGAIAAAERLLEAVRDRYVIDGDHVDVTASVGIELAATGEAGAMLRDAELAMRGAKRAGGDCYEVYDVTMRTALSRRLSDERELRHALERDEVELGFEPIVSLENGRVLAAEARLRWHHPERGLLAPGDVLDIAELSGLDRLMDRWAVFEACRTVAALDAGTDLELAYLAIGASARHIASGGLAGIVAEAVEETGIDPGRLALEMTESALLAGTGGPQAAVDELRGLGVRLLLDDFGTGFSSLGYLKRFPLDAVRIDRQFVTPLADEGGDRHVVQAMIAMAYTLGLDVVAGGVADVEQARWLRRLGCGVAQGPLFGGVLGREELFAAASDVTSPAIVAAFGRVDERPLARPAGARWTGGESRSLTPSEAAAALGVSASTVRRLADSGRLPTVRTAGGHRRFLRADVEQFAGRIAQAPRLRALASVTGPMPAAAALIAQAGVELAGTAGRAIYDERSPGWLANPGREALERWSLGLAAACREGDADAAGDVTLGLLDDALDHGAELPELDAFLGQFLGLVLRGLRSQRTPLPEMADVNRLFAHARRSFLSHAATV